MPELAIEESDELEVSPGDTPDSITIRPRFAPTAPTKLVTAENDSQGCPVHSTGGRDICICGEERDDRGALKEDPDNPSPAPPTFEDGLSFCRHGLHRHRLPDGSYCLWAERAPRPVCVCYRNDQLINVVAGEIPGNGAAVVMSNENVRIETGCYPILVRLTSRIRWELAATAALDHPGEINLLNTLTGDIGDLLLADGTPLFSDPTDPVFPGGFGDCSFQIPMAHQHDGEVADPGAQGGAFQVFRVWDHLQKVDGPKVLIPPYKTVQWSQAMRYVGPSQPPVSPFSLVLKPGYYELCFDGDEVTSPYGVISTPDGALDGES